MSGLSYAEAAAKAKAAASAATAKASKGKGAVGKPRPPVPSFADDRQFPVASRNIAKAASASSSAGQSWQTEWGAAIAASHDAGLQATQSFAAASIAAGATTSRSSATAATSGGSRNPFAGLPSAEEPEAERPPSPNPQNQPIDMQTEMKRAMVEAGINPNPKRLAAGTVPLSCPIGSSSSSADVPMTSQSSASTAAVGTAASYSPQIAPTIVPKAKPPPPSLPTTIAAGAGDPETSRSQVRPPPPPPPVIVHGSDAVQRANRGRAAAGKTAREMARIGRYDPKASVSWRAYVMCVAEKLVETYTPSEID